MEGSPQQNRRCTTKVVCVALKCSLFPCLVPPILLLLLLKSKRQFFSAPHKVEMVQVIPSAPWAAFNWTAYNKIAYKYRQTEIQKYFFLFSYTPSCISPKWTRFKFKAVRSYNVLKIEHNSIQIQTKRNTEKQAPKSSEDARDIQVWDPPKSQYVSFLKISWNHYKDLPRT